MNWILRFAFYPPLHSNALTKKYKTFHISCNGMRSVDSWLVDFQCSFSLIGWNWCQVVRHTVSRVVDDVTEEEIKHGYNIAATHRTYTLAWFFDHFRLHNLSFSSVIHPTRKHFFEKISFLDPHLFRLTKTKIDDTFLGGSDNQP